MPADDLILKQWVSVIDERTTMVCLDAAGMVRPVDEPFDTINGSYDSPPAHIHCRSVVQPYMRGFGQEIKKKANAEIQKRPLSQRRKGPDGYTGKLPPKPTPQVTVADDVVRSADDLEAQIAMIQEERAPMIKQLLDDAYGRKALDPVLKAKLEAQSQALYNEQMALRELIAQAKPTPVLLRASDDAKAAYDDLVRALDDDARMSVQRFAGNEYRQINGSIPEGKTLSLRGVNPDYVDDIRSIDGSMDSIAGKTLYRGMTNGLDDLRVGDVVTSNGFVSTSTDVHTAAGFSQSAGSVTGTVQVGDTVTLFRISAGPRAQGVAINRAEYEVLLKRGSKLKVTGFSNETIDGVHYRFVEVRL